jgi:hypothetical protein
MDFTSSIIPASVLAAILLFIVRECLDFAKRRRADRLRLKAIKKVISRELELNLGTIKNIQQIIANAKACLVEDQEISEKFHFAIKKDETGETSFSVYMERDSLCSRVPIRKVHAELLAKHLVDIAALDNAFSEKADAAYDAQMELAHVRASLLQHLNPGHPDYEEELTLPFCEYATEELESVFSALNTLYIAAKGEHLIQSRLR